MKKQYLAWGLAISLSIGTILGNSSLSWAVESIKQDQQKLLSDEDDNEADFWQKLSLSTSSNATELATSSNGTPEITENKSVNTTSLQERFVTEDGIIIEIDSHDMILPEDTQIKIKKVTLENEISDSVQSAMLENQKELEQIYAYDISFWSGGEEFEPSDEVKITFKLPDTLTPQQLDESEIFHVKDGDNFAEFISKTVDRNQEISCQSVGFSIYGIALAQTKNWVPIYTAEDLQNIENNLSANYKLMNNINLSGIKWTPLGASSVVGANDNKVFNGIFDGQNYTISNLEINPSEPHTAGIGLFGTIGTGTIKNLTIDSASIIGDIKDSYACGILAGYCTGIIENCHVKNSTINIQTELLGSVGGLVAEGEGIQADNCTFRGDINVICSKKQEISLTVGGIIAGSSYSNIYRCFNYGNISINYINEAASSPYEINVGGISGWSGSESSVVEQCANMGNINVNKNNYFNAMLGGLFGVFYSGTINNSYNLGNFECQGTGNPTSGGIIGLAEYDVNIKNCYNLGKTSYGIIGDYDSHDESSLNIKNCYYINTAETAYPQNKNDVSPTNVKKCSTNELKQQNTYQNFDFEDIWTMGTDDYPYPILQSQKYTPSQPDLPNVPDNTDQVGWVSLENGNIGYYSYQNNQLQLLKSGVYQLNYVDKNRILFNGKWKFDENGYVMTGMHDGLYYYEDHDGLYPYGMCVPDKGIDEILKETYNQSHILPSTILSGYSYVTTFTDDLNDMSYYLSANIDDGWMLLTGTIFPDLFKRLGFVNMDDINVQYLMTDSNNRKILAKVLDIKFPEEEKTPTSIDTVALATAWDSTKNVRGYAEFIKAKINDALKNEDKYSDTFNELAKEVQKNNYDSSVLDEIAETTLGVFDAILEQVSGWSDALKDCSEKLNYLEAMEESINKIDSGKIKNIQNLKNAISALKSNYEERIKLQIFESTFALIEQGNSWRQAITGEKRPLAGWDFKEAPQFNMEKVAASIMKDAAEESLPLLNAFSKGITAIQTIDGRPEAINTIAQTEMLYYVAYDVLRDKEARLLKNGDSEALADYLNAFEFMRCITILRYKTVKMVYETPYNRDGLKQIKIDFLQNEINKLQEISPFNYYKDTYSPLTFAGSWDESGEKYYYGTNRAERFYIVNRWAYINNKRYYFDQNGRVLTGAQKIKDETGEWEYYFSTGDGTEYNKDHRGAMQTGPIKINGKEYYYNQNAGVNRGRKVVNSRIQIGPKDYRYYGPDGAYDREKSGFSEVTDSDPNHKFYNNGGIRYATNCPVDIIIYNESDNMVGKIQNDTVQNITDNNITAYIDSAGQKIVGIPQNGKYKLEIIARDAGTMDYSVAEFASDGSGLIGKTDYRSVTLNQADHFYGITESMFYNGEEHNWYRLLKESSELEATEYQGTLTNYLINTSVEGRGTVEGSQSAIRGDFAKLIALPAAGCQFIGWYDENGNCVSKEPEFRFRVLEEKNFTAKFTTRSFGNIRSDHSSSHHDSSYTSSKQSTAKWIKNDKGWWYQRSDGTWPHDEWCELEYAGQKDWYYFDKNGYVVSGWLPWNGCYFYLNPLSNGWFGKMETGWKQIDGKWYYFEPVSGRNKGHLFINTVTPDGYKVDSNGVWIN